MADLFVRQRVLVLGSEHFVATKVQTALLAGDWATPVPFTGPACALGEKDLDGIHAVFNGTMGRPDAVLEGARALYGILTKSGKQLRVVHLSSMTVYGSRGGETLEGVELRSDIGAYGAAQVQAELLAGRYPHSVILRPGCEYGPHCPQWSERIARLLISHRLGDLGAAGDGTCNLVYVDDFVMAITRALKLPGIDGACFNLAMPSPPTWNDYFTLFARALGAVPVSRLGARRLKIEARVLAPPLKLLEMLERRLVRSSAVPPAITPSLLSLCAQNITLVSRRAEQAFDLVWTPLGEGLRQAAAASKNSGG